jgi:hypothetical protein
LNGCEGLFVWLGKKLKSCQFKTDGVVAEMDGSIGRSTDQCARAQTVAHRPRLWQGNLKQGRPFFKKIVKEKAFFAKLTREELFFSERSRPPLYYSIILGIQKKSRD